MPGMIIKNSIAAKIATKWIIIYRTKVKELHLN